MQFPKLHSDPFFVIATHSPILLCYPGATVLKVDDSGIHAVEARETEHVRLTLEFLNAQDRYFRHLFAPPDAEGGE